MIARLRGRIAEFGDDWLVIDVGGVGYLVHCSSRTLARLPGGEAIVDLHIETQVRDDSITLYGFLEHGERVWFRLLQTIQGVGARVALALLATLEPGELVAAVAAQDRVAVTRAPGVGPRLASRIVAELRERFDKLPTVTAGPARAGAIQPAGGIAADAVSALVNLGYGRSEAFAAVGEINDRLGASATVDVLIREGLTVLSRRLERDR